MKITIGFFSFSAQAGTAESVLELPEGATMAALAGVLREQHPALFPQAERALYLVNHQASTRDTLLKDGDRILMLQILGGG